MYNTEKINVYPNLQPDIDPVGGGIKASHTLYSNFFNFHTFCSYILYIYIILYILLLYIVAYMLYYIYIIYMLYKEKNYTCIKYNFSSIFYHNYIMNIIKKKIKVLSVIIMCMFFNGCLMCYHKVHTLWCWWHIINEKW